jgi:hypothetical protein
MNVADHRFGRVHVVYAMVAAAVVVAFQLSIAVSPGRAAEEEIAERTADEAGANAAPEDVLLDFLLAVFACDAEGIERTSVPHPDAVVLTQGQKTPPEALAEMQKRLPESFSRVKLGEQVELPDGKTIIADETHVNEDRVEIKVPDGPIPFIVVREEGAWKVEPDPIIHGRLAAKRAAAGSDPEEWPRWSPVETSLEQLDKETQHGRVGIRAPRGYARPAEGDAAATFWSGPVRDDMTQANFSIIVTKLTPELAKLSLDEMLTSSLSGVAKRRDRFRLGTIEHGEIAEKRFARVRWTGVSKPTTRPEYSGRAMRGFVYGTIADGEFILFMSQDLESHARDALQAAEASVLTARIKPSRTESAPER